MQPIDEILGDERLARLIPIVADSRREERLVSILLATLAEVRPLAKAILERCEIKVGKYSNVTSYTEVEFPSLSDENNNDRPDGVLCLNTGKTRWMALVEAKVDREKIDSNQIQRYADVAQRYRMDAIITFSNQFVSLPAHIPYVIPSKLKKKIKLFHFSWGSILTEAHLILRNNDELSDEKAYVLREMVRYFDHDKSGIKRFTQMQKQWKAVVLGIQNKQEFKSSSPEIEGAVASWHQEERDISLELSRRIGQQVRIGMSYKHKADPERRLRDNAAALSKLKELRSPFKIPNAASNLEVVANLLERTIICSMELNAPEDRKRASAKINWLLKQLKSVDDNEIQIRAFWPGKTMRTQKSLSEVRADVKCLVEERSQKGPTRFEIIKVRNIGAKFSQPRGFVEELEKVVPEYYDQVGQHLRTWRKPPPVIDKGETAQTLSAVESTSDDTNPTVSLSE